MINKVQEFLGIPVSGLLDDFTSAALRNYQIKNGLIANGILDDPTIEKMFPGENLEADTDKRMAPIIHKKYLDKDEYLGPSKKKFIFGHHTAGWNNPYATVEDWNNDNRGPVGTQYIIGGLNPATGDPTFDGEIVECMPDGGWGWNLTIGTKGDPGLVHASTVGIELCNFGWVTKDGVFADRNNLKGWVAKPKGFYSWAGTRIQANQVVDLKMEFRGFRYFVKYSDKQLEALQYLIPTVAAKHGIDHRKGLQERLKRFKNPVLAFEYDDKIKAGKESSTGLYCHSNVYLSGKWDWNPQPNLIEMILSL